MTFETSIQDIDLARIIKWTAQDHSKLPNLSPYYWLTGAPDCILACRVDDSGGPILYLRAEQEDTLVRFHTLFAPVNEVSQQRIVFALLEGFPQFANAMKVFGSGLVMMTQSKPLAAFMVNKFGFVRVEGTDDYRMDFAEPVVDCGTGVLEEGKGQDIGTI